MNASQKISSSIRNADIPRSLLHSEFKRRSAVNPRYSLRRFAQQLEIDPSLLSKIIQGKRKISAEIAKKVIKNGNLSANEKEVFISQYLKEQLDHESEMSSAENAKQKERALSQAVFGVISDPIHYVILEMLSIPKFRKNLDTMAHTLEMTRAQIQSCLRRLRTVGLVSGSHLSWTRLEGRNLIADPKVSGPSMRLSHRRILEKSIQAMDNVPIEKRSHLWMTFPVNPSKLPIAQALLEEYRGKITDLLEEGPTESVYHLSFNLFPAHRTLP
jgi:uncharacterized protein (TIGR02147 family)